eukprot:1158387-Pelagomonas_calceolata.AAC.10
MRWHALYFFASTPSVSAPQQSARIPGCKPLVTPFAILPLYFCASHCIGSLHWCALSAPLHDLTALMRPLCTFLHLTTPHCMISPHPCACSASLCTSLHVSV